MSKPRIAFIGMGIMGKAMALRLCKAGFPLAVFNRTAGRAKPVVEAGAREAKTPADAAADAEVVIVMVKDTPDVEAVLFSDNGVAAKARPGTVIVDMTTISPDATRAIAQRLRAKGLEFLDAPVSGGDIGARDGTLTIMVGGEAKTLERVQPIFAELGKRITLVGPNGAGQAVKACNQLLGAINLVGVCEALSLADSMGVDPAVMVEVVSAGAANSWSLEKLGPRIVNGDFAPGFKVGLLQKDLAIVLDAARTGNLPLPATELAQRLYRSVQELEGDEVGTQALIKVYQNLKQKP
jgi:3-hydroxyisobutyrate dehydrogenase